MIIKNTPFGDVELDIFIDFNSAVDSYAQSGYSLTLDRELTDDELDQFSDEVQEYAYANGSMRPD